MDRKILNAPSQPSLLALNTRRPSTTSVSSVKGTKSTSLPKAISVTGANRLLADGSTKSLQISMLDEYPSTPIDAYDPEAEATSIKEGALKQKNISFKTMFRYATFLDYLLMAFALLLAALSAVAMPVLLYRHGFFYRISEELVHGCLDVDYPFGDNEIYIHWTLGFFMVALFLSHLAAMLAAKRQVHAMRIAYLQGIMQKDSSWFDNYIDRNLSRRLTVDITEIRNGIGENWPKLVYLSLSAIFLLILAVWLDYQLTLISLAAGTVYGVFFFLKVSREENINRAEQRAYKAGDNYSGQIFSSVRCMKIYQGEEKAVKEYSKTLVSARKFKKEVLQLSLTCIMVWILIFCCYASIMYAGYSIDSFPKDNVTNSMSDIVHSSGCDINRTYQAWELPPSPSFSRVFVVFLAVFFSAQNSAFLPLVADRIRRAKKRAAQVFFIIDWKCRLANMSIDGEMPRKNGIGKVELINAILKYPRKPDTLVLKYLSLTVYPGQMVTLLGPSGSGKTTILRAMQRIYDLSSGKVKFDGFPVTNLNLRWLRSQFGVIPENPILFNGTIEENVRLGKWTATEEEVIYVCKRVEIHQDIIWLPQGYKTEVGKKSTANLSQLQIKKISLARVLLQNPRVFLLDEVITDINHGFETMALKLFEELRDKHTIIFATDTVNSIVKNCDIIFLLKDGKIMEQGNHENMITKKSYYSNYFNESSNRKSGVQLFKSQYFNYKYADAIERNHQFNDRSKKKLENSPSDTHPQDHAAIINKFEFTNDGARWVPPRITAGFHSFSYYSFFENNGYFFRKRVQNALLLRREKRLKVKAPEKKEGILKKRPETRSPVSSPTTPDTDNSFKIFTMGEDVNFIKKYSNDEFVQEQQTSEFAAIEKDKEKDRFKEGKTMRVVGGEKLRHYFGCTINSSPESDSLKTEDSFNFWSSYIQSLQIALDDQKKVKCGEFFCIGFFFWPFMTVGAVCAVWYGLFVGSMVEINVEIFRDFIAFRRRIVDSDGLLAQGLIWACCTAVVAFVQETVLGFGSYRMNNKIRKFVFKYLLYQDAKFWDFSENDIGFLRDSLASDIPLVQITLVSFITTTAQSIVHLIFMTFVCLNSKVYIEESLIMFPIVLLLTLLCYYEGRLQSEYTVCANAKFTRSKELEFEVVTEIRHIIMLGLEDHMLSEYKSSLQKTYLRSIIPLIFFRSIVFSVTQSMFFIAYHLWWEISEDTYLEEKNYYIEFHRIGDYFLLMLIPLGYAFARIPNYNDTCASASIIVEAKKFLQKKKQDEKSLKKLIYSPSQNPPLLYLYKLEFSYPAVPDQIIFSGVTLEIPPKSYVAVVGDQDSGKHALIDVLMGLYEPNVGSILMDNIDYKNIMKSSLRNIVGLVEQDPTFMYMSLAENIAYGDNSREVPMDEIIEAAKKSHIHDLIESMQNKYDTNVTDLPAGTRTFCFRQRLAVAREFIHNPKIILVDQATSSLDQNNYELLADSLKKLRQGRTFFITSQRIEPIREADVIVVLVNGSVVELGNDKNLLKKKGVYYEMYQAQKLFEAKL